MGNEVDLFDVDELELDDLTVTSMRDTVALPETAASCAFCAECFSTVSSCFMD